ncbi:MAG: response regulator transcription factor [Clostridia bacterium]|nr:response regulator transcription factor [Clostridia bacterium]
MRWRIAIADDDGAICADLASQVEAWGREAGIALEVRSFPSAEALLFDMGDEGPFDILLLDVEMGGMSGLELAGEIRKGDRRCEIVFVTSHYELAGAGYEVDALHYLMKPVKKEKLTAVLHKAVRKLSVKPKTVLVTAEGEILRLPVEEILYVEAFLHYIEIHTETRKYRIKDSIAAFAEKLGPGFFRTHRSYLVNLLRVTRIARTGVTVEGGSEIPLARGKYDEVNRAYIERN